MAKALMIQGTGSGAGKSVIVAGLCRIFRDLGIKVAPFKAQNMALNSFITKECGEIGRAQVFQAEAAGVEPENDMNPVLLKATGESGSQVIFNGKVYKTMKAEEYYAIKDKAWEKVTAAYDRLASRYELIIIEGAGSPAEINLLDNDIVNMKMARYANAPVILVGDINRGGLFASLYGTVELLKGSVQPFHNYDFSGTYHNGESDADYIKGFIVNKFRGNMDILRPGLRMLEKKTGKLFIGVIHWQANIGLDEEDGLSIERVARFKDDAHDRPLKVSVLRLRRISNFTDFTPFLYEPDINFKFTLWEEDILNADLVLIPGTKNTVHDLLFIRERGLDRVLSMASEQGVMIAGICGGYQMLGQKIYDPRAVESDIKEIDGLGMLDIETTLNETKTTFRVTAEIMIANGKWQMEDGKHIFHNPFSVSRNPLEGYEIHMGNTTGDMGLFSLKRISSGSKIMARNSELIPDGSVKGNVWGTYIHGIFDNDEIRTSLINALRVKKGLKPRAVEVEYFRQRAEAINRWAGQLKNSVDICFLLRQLGMESYQKNYCEKIRS